MRLKFFLTLLLCVFISTFSFGQTNRNRISQAPSDAASFRLRGNVAPRIAAATDVGTAAASMPLSGMTIAFSRTQAQQDSLDALLAQQQDPSSPNYHKWLTPEQFADRFALSQSDMDKVEAWLKAQGFGIVDRARSRTSITFSGTAAQVAAAFHTQIHRYQANGDEHFANATEPEIPAAFAGVVLGIRSLHDFHPRPRSAHQLAPRFTSSVSGNHFLAPDDVATIYNLTGLYNSGIDGTGQKMAVMGQTDLVLSDIATFRSVSGLTANVPQIVLVPGSGDPGVVKADIGEADLDVELAGAVARNATIVYVNSGNGAFDSLQYAVSQNIAPVISISYGDCEPDFSTAELNTFAAMGQQASAQGQTIIAPTGDSGAADCDFPLTNAPLTSATHGLAVDLPGALPTSTSVGGTTFSENGGNYWSLSNSASNESALSYIPEVAWNDTTTDITNGGSLSATGGGASVKFAKPSWQQGVGVPNDGARDVPDISIAASSDHDGFLICSQGSCVNGYRAADSSLTVFGGTSASVPVFAGLVALINQKIGTPQGNVNPMLYSLAANAPYVIHDVTSGDNRVPCTSGTKDCPSGTSSIGFSAGVGYDLVTGLGSVDAFSLATEWNTPAAADFQVTPVGKALTVTHGTVGTQTISLAGLNGFSGTATLSCTVAASLTGTTCSLAPGTVTAGGTATLTITAPAQISSLRNSSPNMFAMWLQSGMALSAGLFFVGGKRTKRQRIGQCVWLGILLVCLLLVAVSCGGGGSNSTTTTTGGGGGGTTTPPTQLTGAVTVKAVSGSITHSMQVAVTIN